MRDINQLAVDIDRKMSELTHENMPMSEGPVMAGTKAALPFPPMLSNPGGELETPHYMPRAHAHAPTVGKPTEMDFDQGDKGGMGAKKKHWLAAMQRHHELAAEKEARATEWQESLHLRKERESKCLGCGEDHKATEEFCEFISWFTSHGGVRQVMGNQVLYLCDTVKLFVRNEPIECAWVRSELWTSALGRTRGSRMP
jgi:hypothetical protein